MRIGLDYRPALAAPNSGIGRQVRAMEQALLGEGDIALERFGEAPADHPLRNEKHCHFPAWPCPLNGMHRPRQRLRFETRFLPCELRRLKPDLYIATANMGLPFPAPAHGTRYILLLHDLFQLTHQNYHASAVKKLVYRCIDRVSIGYALSTAARVWTPSQYTADEVARLFPRHRNKTRVLPNQVTPFTVPPEPPKNITLPQRFWLAVGTREPRKNIPRFVTAWARAREQAPDVVPSLILVGGAEDLAPQLRTLAELHIIENVTDAELHGLYRQAAAFWHPSCAEGFGMPVVEAMLTGTPVYAARGSALDEIVPPGMPRYDPHDDTAMTRLMLEVAAGNISMPASSELTAWGARYDENAYRRRLLELLEEACR